MDCLVNYSSEDENDNGRNLADDRSSKKPVASSSFGSRSDARTKSDSRHRNHKEESREKHHHTSADNYRDKKLKKDSFKERKETDRYRANDTGNNSNSKDFYNKDRKDNHREERHREKKRDHRDDRRKRDNYREREPDKSHDREKTRKEKHRETEKPRRSNSPKDRNRSERKKRSRSESNDRSTTATVAATTTSIRTGSNLNSSREHNVSKERPETTVHPIKIKPEIETVVSLPLNNIAPVALAKPNEPVASVLPSYYNPNIINPNKYADQVQKRKLIWGAKKAEDTSGKWNNAKFSKDDDGKVQSKFMRLMGIKSTPKNDPAETGEKSTTTDIKRREDMFSSMEQQYEVARQVTHTMRGVGLGFGSQSRQF